MRKMIIMTAIAMMASGAVAQITPNLDQGTKSLQLSGSLDTDHPLDTQVTFQIGYGYFIQDAVQIAALGGVTDNDLVTTYELGAAAEYNFLTETVWVPFVGAGILWKGAEVDTGDGDDPNHDGVVGRLLAGVKYFIDDNVGITLDGAYDIASEDIYTNQDGEREDTNFQVLLGIRFYFD